ncbi:RNA ligase family protein [Pleionea sediminis]|uniref:RNA ligase family protein n=1 Tax=Pleionea sediminis TaxID=2569479 RepID=UPI0011870895|nr:RNA ligase family protein [Pleionea sediminis]
MTSVNDIVPSILYSLQSNQVLSDYVVRGSFVNQQWMSKFKRPVNDLDLMLIGDFNEEKVSHDITAALNNVKYKNITLDSEVLSIESIWQESVTPGLRFVLPVHGIERVSELQIDVSAEEPVSMALNKGQLLDCESGKNITYLSIPLETSIAWKFHGLFEHVNGAWQSKTLWDLYVLCRYNTINKKALIDAIHLAFESRLDPLSIVKRLLYGDFGSSRNSRKLWEKDSRNLFFDELHPLDKVLSWVKQYFIELLNIPDDGELLTSKECIEFRKKLLIKQNTPFSLAKINDERPIKTNILKRAYLSIPHLSASRLGMSSKCISQAQEKMLTHELKQSGDRVIIQEKLDGSCVCALRDGGDILALGKEGDLASQSRNESRRLWSDWVVKNKERLLLLLNEGERVCGEWMVMAHGTRYRLPHEPFVLFDIFDSKNHSYGFDEVSSKASKFHFSLPAVIHAGAPLSVKTADSMLGKFGRHGAIDEAEGLIYRYERNNKILFRAKYVRKNKVDGRYLEENTGKETVWNLVNER